MVMPPPVLFRPYSYLPFLHGASAYVVASNAPQAIKEAAAKAERHFLSWIYICDGTADNVEIQAAINELLSDVGGTVALSAGTFNLAAVLTVSTKTARLCIRGEGRATNLSANTDAITALKVTSPTRTEADYYGGHLFQNFNIHGVSGGGSGGDAILVDYSKYNTFENITVTGSRRYAANLDNWARYNTFVGCELVGGTAGVILQSSAAIASTPCNDNKFVACPQIRGSGGPAILITSDDGASRNLFDDCSLDSDANAHIVQIGDDSAVSVDHNSVVNCRLVATKTTLTDNTYDGIYLLGARYGSFVGNSYEGYDGTHRLRYAVNPDTNSTSNQIWVSTIENVVAKYPDLTATSSHPFEDSLNLSRVLQLSGNASLASAADLVLLGGYDLSGGNRTLALATETAVATDAGLVSTHSLTVHINGVNYKIMLVSA